MGSLHQCRLTKLVSESSLRRRMCATSCSLSQSYLQKSDLVLRKNENPFTSRLWVNLDRANRFSDEQSWEAPRFTCRQRIRMYPCLVILNICARFAPSRIRKDPNQRIPSNKILTPTKATFPTRENGMFRKYIDCIALDI